MPGTIQVSVLDFEGLHPSSPSSQISIKVSMGKREFQTWEKGEFSFPLTTLHDNLVVTLQDAEGNDISHKEIETRLVVEKGVWDNLFPLEGGGHVHMKLQFVLSDEEHQRIRIMRESALKKKHDKLQNSGHGSPENASISYNEVSGSPESLLQSKLLAYEANLGPLPSIYLNNAKCILDDKDKIGSIQKPNSTDSVSSELKKASKKQGPVGKVHSNIREMISAFEGTQNQNVKPSIKQLPIISQAIKTKVDSFLTNSHLKEFEQTKVSIKEKVQKIGSVKPIYYATSSKEAKQMKDTTASCSETERKIFDMKNSIQIKQKECEVKEEKIHTEDSKRASMLEKAAFSRRMLYKHSKGNRFWNLFSTKQHSSRKSVTKEDDYCSIGTSGLWIFPGEAKCLCITTGGKQIMDLMGGFWDETNFHHKKLSGVDRNSSGDSFKVNANDGIPNEASEDGKISSQNSRPEAENSVVPEDSTGPVGQVIKIAIMVGFATLVLLTRKRTYR